jgi:hypothetical protein
MKLIVNNHTALTVEDGKGNVLYEWNPFKDIVIRVEDIDKYPNEYIQNYLNNKK